MDSPIKANFFRKFEKEYILFMKKLSNIMFV